MVCHVLFVLSVLLFCLCWLVRVLWFVCLVAVLGWFSLIMFNVSLLSVSFSAVVVYWFASCVCACSRLFILAYVGCVCLGLQGGGAWCLLCCLRVVLCIVVLCLIVLCIAVLCMVVVCIVVLCVVVWCFVVLCVVVLCYAVLCIVVLRIVVVCSVVL